MPRYRAKPQEVEAFQMASGDYIVCAEPPRVVSAAAFEQVFEPLPERRAIERRTARKASGGRRRQDRTVQSIAATKAPAPTEKAAKPASDREARKTKGLAMLADGKAPSEVAKALEVSVSAVYLWREQAKGATGNGKTAPITVRTSGESEVNHDGGWMR